MNLPFSMKTRSMKNRIIPILLTALVAIGCHKKESATAVTTPPALIPDATNKTQAAANTAKPLPPAPTYIVTKADNVVRQTVSGEVDLFMTGQLHIFVQQKGRMPESFTEFANTRLDSIPRPPDGTKWAIDTAAVQVKAVQINQ